MASSLSPPPPLSPQLASGPDEKAPIVPVDAEDDKPTTKAMGKAKVPSAFDKLPDEIIQQ